MRVLFVGGTGKMSAACVAAAAARGFAVTVVSRGETAVRAVPDGVEVVRADVREPGALRSALGRREFDVVAEFLAYEPARVRADLELFRGRIGQYVFISSCAVYEVPARKLPISESAPRRSSWKYARDKIAGEEILVRAHRDEGFPATIVRPFHTYDRTVVPVSLMPFGGWTVIDRMRRGLPIVVPGDGTSLWALLHSGDFATGFVGLLGNPRAIGESVHITSSEPLTWNQIHELLAAAAGVQANLVHVTSRAIARVEPEVGARLLGSIAHSLVFDNGKIKALVPEFAETVPFAAGAREIVGWFDARRERRVVDEQAHALFDRLAAVAA
jgi:nucleoside-diphosphate-sugar epimerase